MLVIFLYILLLAQCSCKRDILLSKPKIVGGEKATLKEIFYQASLQYFNGTEYMAFCGGVLISLRHILTAAHCLYLKPLSKSGAQFEAGDIIVYSHMLDSRDATQAQIRHVRYIYKHEEFGNPEKYSNDIAILVTWRRFKRKLTLRPIPLRTQVSVPGEECVVSGYGSLSTDGEFSFELLKVTLPIVALSKCQKKYGPVVSKKMLCAGESGKDACRGDSGGPMVCKGKLAGIISFGYKCGLPDYPGVYTEVSKYTDWIEKKLRSRATRIYCTCSFYLIILIYNLVNDF